VGLTVYHGQAWDLPASVLQDVLDAVTAGAMSVPIAGVFSGLEHVPDAHRALDSHAMPGKNVVVLG
jgi:putative NAD(P)H dehydrogenase (quinone)